jgi:hypothetical protein
VDRDETVSFPLIFVFSLATAVVNAIRKNHKFVGMLDLRRVLDWYCNADYPRRSTLFSPENKNGEGRVLYVLMRGAHVSLKDRNFRKREVLRKRVVGFMQDFPHGEYSKQDALIALNFFHYLANRIKRYEKEVIRREGRVIRKSPRPVSSTGEVRV